MKELPPTVQAVADVIGLDLALKLVMHSPRWGTDRHTSGHSQLYIPKVVPAGHMLRELLGDEAANKLAYMFGGDALCMASPKCVDVFYRRRGVVNAVRDGVPRSMVAEWFGITQRWVNRIMRELAPMVPA